MDADGKEMLNSRDVLVKAIESGLILLINLIALLGNLFLCLVIFNKPRFHTTANTFMLALTMCYAFIACLVMPFTAGSLITGHWVFGRVVCDIQAISFFALTWISLLTLTSMVISRCFQVTRLACYNKWFSLNRSYVMIVANWGFVIMVLICTEANSSKIYQFSPNDSLCSISFSGESTTKHTLYAVITLILYVLLPVALFIVWSAMQRYNAHVYAAGQTNQRSDKEMRAAAEERKTNRILLAMIMAVLTFWLPAVVINILAYTMSLPRQAHLASTFFWFVVPVMHPIIYAVLHRSFSKELLRMLPMSGKRRNKVHAEEAI